MPWYYRIPFSGFFWVITFKNKSCLVVVAAKMRCQILHLPPLKKKKKSVWSYEVYNSSEIPKSTLKKTLNACEASLEKIRLQNCHAINKIPNFNFPILISQYSHRSIFRWTYNFFVYRCNALLSS